MLVLAEVCKWEAVRSRGIDRRSALLLEAIGCVFAKEKIDEVTEYAFCLDTKLFILAYRINAT